MSPVQQLTSILGSRHPVLLAPMAGISGGRLARAVGEAGGFGLVGGGYGDAAWLAEELALCQGSPFGVGFITWSLQRQPALLAQALQAGARAVMLSFGDVEPFVAQVRDEGAVLIAQVQTVEQARLARRAGAQVIVAQGGEGGGHSGVRGTMALVPAVCDAVDVPVVAAGGIADGRGLAAALALGAAGVLAGTVFYAARESLANERAKDRLVEASGDDTVKSDVFDAVRGLQWPAGPWGLRTLRNGFTDRWHGQVDALRQDMPQLRDAYEAARQRSDFDVAAVIAGEAADLVRAVRPAREILDDMVAGAGAILGRLPGVLSRATG
ncbi:MAG: nitronate monooxygenase [Pseudomonadota bacterium]